uniref:Carbonic anhydrase n=1 Tax=Plectus sambesii TaxID=2011161 RepID=A0A914VI57_9BILA
MAIAVMVTTGGLLLLTALACFAEASTVQGHDENWGYTGVNGPDSWPEICQSGHRQSPININLALIDAVNISRLNFGNYDRHGTITLTNNGHTAAGTGFENWSHRPYISGGGLDGRYDLVSFHFHWAANDHLGSEHTVGSLSYPMELHLVHIKEGLTQNESLVMNDGMAVIAVFFYKGLDGRPLGQVEQAFRKTLYYGSQEEVSDFQLMSLLPEDTDAFYRYEGSLTTPSCSESVIWTLMAEPVCISELQLQQLRKHISTMGNLLARSHRNPQPLHGRRILFRPHDFEQHCDPE